MAISSNSSTTRDATGNAHCGLVESEIPTAQTRGFGVNGGPEEGAAPRTRGPKGPFPESAPRVANATRPLHVRTELTTAPPLAAAGRPVPSSAPLRHFSRTALAQQTRGRRGEGAGKLAGKRLARFLPRGAEVPLGPPLGGPWPGPRRSPPSHRQGSRALRTSLRDPLVRVPSSLLGCRGLRGRRSDGRRRQDPSSEAHSAPTCLHGPGPGRRLPVLSRLLTGIPTVVRAVRWQTDAAAPALLHQSGQGLRRSAARSAGGEVDWRGAEGYAARMGSTPPVRPTAVPSRRMAFSPTDCSSQGSTLQCHD
ncbi:translation initiation factor IF-2-like [Elephas maximus indicus]|uniref:translation initiation factor IF-2-like n=1 Tax=Elephas maximus indicus TaxID=99487 RepID=UPI002116F72E|nr:translation initiation factor IF-2-like [Elephas maximus indicus]